jgi:RNA polymerase sigma factor (sigma-70 family)
VWSGGLAQRAEPVPAATAEVVDMVAALRRLPLRQREVLVLFYVVELPVEEIGRQLRLPVGTVKSRLARGRTALARLLDVDGSREEASHA